MKTITPFLLLFAFTAILLTIGFRYFLSYGITHKSSFIIILSAALYAVSMFIAGWYFGKKDGNYLPVLDIGFRFHFTTYSIHNGISLLWFVLGYNATYEKIQTVYNIAIIWGVLLIVHFLFFLWTRKYAINSLDKDDLFE